MHSRHGTTRFLVPLWLVLTSLAALHCKSEPAAEQERAPNLQLEILAIDTSAMPRDGRPFIAGETLRLTLRVQGGVPPYELQLATAVGSPTLANASTQVEATGQGGEAIEVGMEIPLASEVPTGSYELLLRVTDDQGIGASVRSEPLEVIGADAPLATLVDSPAQVRIVDVAGRERASFFQGEQIHIRARVSPGETVAVTVLASDERLFMPIRTYEPDSAQLDLSLRIPRLARVGSYLVVLATEKSETRVPLMVIGRAFAAASTPVLEELQLLGGKDFRVVKKATLRRGETLRIEARVGGIHNRATARLRLRTRAGQVVAQAELGEILPSDAHPMARSMLSAAWLPPLSLTRGRHVLEIEITEQDELATLYREIVLH